MQLVMLGFIVTLVLQTAAEQMPAARASLPLAAGLLGAYVAGAGLLTWLRTDRAARCLAATGELPRRMRRWHNALTHLTHVWLVAGTGALVLLGYGGWVQRGLGLARVPLAGDLLTLAPFVAALLLTWWLEYPFYRTVRARRSAASRPENAPLPVWTRRQYLTYNTRHHLLFVGVLVSLILLAHDLAHLYLAPVLPEARQEEGTALATMAAAAGVFLVAPLIVARLWRTRPLPDGPVRRRLEALCRRMRLRYRKLLVWESGGAIANAGVMGLIGRVRYVLLSDGLLDRMAPEQIDAVFAHEAGHIVGHHILYSVLFMLSLLTLGTLGADRLAAALGLDVFVGVGLTGLVLAGVLVAFGWVSRRFERQGDVVAA